MRKHRLGQPVRGVDSQRHDRTSVMRSSRLARVPRESSDVMTRVPCFFVSSMSTLRRCRRWAWTRTEMGVRAATTSQTYTALPTTASAQLTLLGSARRPRSSTQGYTTYENNREVCLRTTARQPRQQGSLGDRAPSRRGAASVLCHSSASAPLHHFAASITRPTVDEVRANHNSILKLPVASRGKPSGQGCAACRRSCQISKGLRERAFATTRI